MSLWSPPGPPDERKAPLAEDYRETPLWWDDVSFPALPEKPLPESADAVVIGAGFTGLAAAAKLAEHGKHVVVVDSGALGEGASGRNAGMIHAGVRRDRRRPSSAATAPLAGPCTTRASRRTRSSRAPPPRLPPTPRTRSAGGCTSHTARRA